MTQALTSREVFIQPGNVFLPGEPSRLCAVVSYGVAFAVFDQVKNVGGVGHYLLPLRQPTSASTPFFAGPAIYSLIQMFKKIGSQPAQLEAFLCGGASNPDLNALPEGLPEENIRIGTELFKKMGVRLSGLDVGGYKARKLVFHSMTGETVISRVDRVRNSDWLAPNM